MADEDDIDDEFIQKFNKLFHKSMGEREQRFEKKLLKSFDTMLGGKFDELRNTLVDTSDTTDNDDEIIPGVNANPGSTPGVNPSVGGDGISPELRARLRQQEQAIKDATAKSDKHLKQYEEEKAQRTKAEERQTLVSLMQGVVKPKLLDMVVDQAHSKYLVRDPDSGQMLWKGEDGETLPVKDGVAAWAKSDIGKEFAPPIEARGRGGRGGEGNNGQITPGKMTIESLGDIITGSIPGQRH